MYALVVWCEGVVVVVAVAVAVVVAVVVVVVVAVVVFARLLALVRLTVDLLGPSVVATTRWCACEKDW